MATHLTSEQRSDLKRSGNKPVPVVDPTANALVDPETNDVYFLVAGNAFERLRSLFDDEPFDIRETYSAQSAAAGQSGWDDPEMDLYDDYDAHKPQS